MLPSDAMQPALLSKEEAEAIIDQLHADYATLGKTRHRQDIQQLKIKVTCYVENDQTHFTAYFIDILEIEFNRMEDRYCKPFLGLGKRKSPEDFIEKVNKSARENTFNYPRLLALLLQYLYERYPEYATERNQAHICKIKNEIENDTYQRINEEAHHK